MSRSTLSLAGAGAVIMAFALAGPMFPAFAAGGGGGGGSGPAPTVCRVGLVFDPVQKLCVPCKRGTVYDADKKACVAQDASLLDDRQLYEQGRSLALAGYYTEALDLLGAIGDKHDAMVLTMIGYATRKLGNLDGGIAIYHQALAIDPENVNTHEYLGEGYVAAGRIDLAELELDKLKALCGEDCEQYQDLAKAIAGDPEWN